MNSLPTLYQGTTGVASTAMVVGYNTTTSSWGVAMWRCRECGAWSHAKHKPRWHRRWLPKAIDGTPHPGCARALGVVLDTPTSHMIKCGPFDRWVAVPG